MSAKVMESSPFYRLNRWFYLITILCGLVFSTSLQHSLSLQPELLSAQTEEVDFYPDPFESDNKFQLIPFPITLQVSLPQFHEELTSDLSFDYSQVYPFSSFAIPPPLRTT